VLQQAAQALQGHWAKVVEANAAVQTQRSQKRKAEDDGMSGGVSPKACHSEGSGKADGMEIDGGSTSGAAASQAESTDNAQATAAAASQTNQQTNQPANQQNPSGKTNVDKDVEKRLDDIVASLYEPAKATSSPSKRTAPYST